MKDFISSNFKRRLSFLLSNSEVSSLLLKLQPFRGQRKYLIKWFGIPWLFSPNDYTIETMAFPRPIDKIILRFGGNSSK